MNTIPKFTQGFRISYPDQEFFQAVRAAVDYRGDITLELKDGTTVEGYIFNFADEAVDLYPKDSDRQCSIPLAHIAALIFSGADAAAGKSWEIWRARKEAEGKKENESSQTTAKS